MPRPQRLRQRPKQRRKTNWWVVVVPIVVGVVLVPVGGWFWFTTALRADVERTSARLTADPNHKRYTREEFEALVLGKTEAEVTAAVGKPTRTTRGGGLTKFWDYDYLTLNPHTGKLDWNAMLTVRHGRVQEVEYFSPR